MKKSKEREKQATKSLKHDLLTVKITKIKMHSKNEYRFFFVSTIYFEWIKSSHNNNTNTILVTIH